MKKNRVRRCLIIILSVIMLTPSQISWAANNVSVTLPTFDVILNGISIENSYSEYPLIVYNNITYFPMTYYDSRFMGLESIWDNTSGLQIFKGDGVWDYRPYTSNKKNNRSYTAQIAPFQIKVNGKLMDNSAEAYPLLLFRNITYFPLTWRFAVEAFGWTYAYESETGLSIHSNAKGVHISDVTLPIVDRGSNGKAFTRAGEYYYYEGDEGQIYQMPRSFASNPKVIYKLPRSEADADDYVASTLYTDHDRAILKYHTGGAIMGSDNFLWLKADGTTQLIDSGYMNLKLYDSFTLKVNQGFPPSSANLLLSVNGYDNYEAIGASSIIYGTYLSETNQTMSSQSNDDLYLRQDDLYLLGFEGISDDNAAPKTTGIYRVSLKSNETERILDDEVKRFKIEGEMIYFIGYDDCLYSVPLGGDTPKRLVDKAVAEFEILGEKVYYVLEEDQQLHIVGQQDALNHGCKLKTFEKQDDKLIAYFDQASNTSFALIVYDSIGDEIYKTLEQIHFVSIQEDEIVLIKTHE